VINQDRFPLVVVNDGQLQGTFRGPLF
jgi:hypothetical protein